MQLYESSEDYLERILILKNKYGFVRAIDIAKDLGFSKASVSIAMKKLRENGYIDIDEKGHIELTKSGLDVANKTYERHIVLTKTLTRLGVNPKTAEEDACKIEHDLSEETFEAIKRYLDK